MPTISPNFPISTFLRGNAIILFRFRIAFGSFDPAICVFGNQMNLAFISLQKSLLRLDPSIPAICVFGNQMNLAFISLQKSLLRLDPSIPAICVCGNHDIGNRPSRDSIAKYRGQFGDDYFSFWIQGTLFIVLNSQYYKDDSLLPGRD